MNANRIRTARLATVIALLLVFGGWSRQAAAAVPLLVSPEGPYTTIASALDAARDGDTITVRQGLYPGALVVDKSVTLEGIDYPVIDAGGRGTVVMLNRPGSVLRGFELRGSGVEPDQDHAGVTLNAARITVENNRLRDVLFGVFVANAPDSVVRGNDITSKDRYETGRKGDSIRLWYSARTLVENNHTFNARDVVIWYSNGAVIRNNFIERGRYGVHLMYCDDATIEENRILDNSVGIYTMYSKNILLRENDLRGQRGPSGYALGFKDAENVEVAHNLLVDNRAGAFLDGTPFSPESYARFHDNAFAFNEIGVIVLPAVRRAQFTRNAFWENTEQVAVQGGGGKAAANEWRGNYWSDYAGFDADGDGVGDMPYRAERFFEGMTDQEPLLRALLYSPAAQALEFAATSFPLVKPLPKLSDPAPLIAPPALAPGAAAAQGSRLGMTAAAFGLLALAAGIARLTRAQGVTGMKSLGRKDTAAEEPTARAARNDVTRAVHAEGVNKRYGKAQVLREVSFEVEPGQALALWGPNGAGKTTLVKAMLGLIQFEGAIEVLGISIQRDGKAARRAIGYVPQEAVFYDWTVQATMEFYARLKRVERARIAPLLDRVGLAAHRDKAVPALSGGLKQRLALAIALLADPPLLLLDEPTANLDPQARGDYLRLLRAVKLDGKTIVFASHRLEEVEALADMVLWLDAERAPRLLSLEVWRGEALPAADLTLWVPADQRARANAYLTAHGWDAHLNGRGTIVVRARAQDKLRALQTLAEQGIFVQDFESERHSA